MNQDHASLTRELRARAESLARQADDNVPASRDDIRRTVHELHVHEIELEMQTEELLRVQGDLEASRNHYADLFHRAPTAYLTLTREGRVADANEAAADLLGCARAELLGRRLPTLVLEKYAVPLHQHRRALESGKRHACEVQVLRSDGSVVDIRIEGVPSMLADTVSRSALFDITAEKRAKERDDARTENLMRLNRELESELLRRERLERKLAEREARGRNAENALERQRGFAERILEAVPALVLSIDETGRILDINSRLAELSGYTLEELIGSEWLARFIPAHAREEVEHAIARALAGAPSEPTLAPFLTRAGAVRTVEWHQATFQNHAGETSGLVVIGQDVTDRNRIQEELRQAQKMESLGTLASGITHDFNNILTGIIGCADVALTKLPAEHPAREQLDHVKNAALGGARTVDRLLAFARRWPAGFKVVDLNHLLTKLEAILRLLLGEDVTLMLSLEAKDAVVFCQVDAIEQLVLNLCVNARQAMPQGGDLIVSTSRTNLERPEGPIAGVLLQVSDTGSGMDEVTKKRAFEPFFTTKQDEGTGLGLSLVYATVKEHGGVIGIDSAPGRGTRVSVSLPLSEESPGPPAFNEAPPPDDLAFDPATILIVEDDVLVRAAMRHYLERNGYRVLEAANEQDVIAILASYDGPIDMLLTDAILPGRGGSEVASTILAARPSVRVAYVSAHSAEFLAHTGRLPSGAETLRKPFSERELVVSVRRIISEPPPPLSAAHTRPRHLLLIEDHDDTRTAWEELLRGFGYEITAVSTGESGLAALRALGSSLDLVITDVNLPDAKGVDFAQRIRIEAPGMPVLLCSGLDATDVPGLEELLAESTVAFIRKPTNLASMPGIIESLLSAALALRTH